MQRPDRRRRGGFQSLSYVRRLIKEDIEQVLADGKARAFDVWISEAADPAAAVLDSWDACMEQARTCDIFIALYNGHSGWAPPGSSVGICQAELQTAVDSAPEKVRLVRLEPDRSRPDDPEREWDASFAAQVQSLNLFRGGRTAADAPTARRVALAALRNAVVELARNGARASRMRSSYQGEALDWNRLDFATRKKRMEAALVKQLLGHAGASPAGDTGAVVPVDGQPTLFVCHAIPAALTIAQAREMVGQPFLRDHEYLPAAPAGTGGPVHLIGCYGNVTDSQARRQLGFPDATVVSPPFGVWVADPVQKIQMLFLAGCVDSVSTRGQADRAFVWLDRAGEARLLAGRARSRATIVEAITAQLARPEGEVEPATPRKSKPRPRPG